MRTICMLSVLTLLAGGDCAVASIQSSFYLDACAWEATHIIVAAEGEKIDGELTVIESWKGDLKAGDRLTVPELASFAPAKTRVISKRLDEEAAPRPANVTGTRMVLFLIRIVGGRAGTTTWCPADTMRKQMRTSVAWVEAGRVFAFIQQENPGSCDLISLQMTECELHCRVDSIVTVSTTLAVAIRQMESAKLAEAIPSLLQMDSSYIRHGVISKLGESGPVGLPAIRAVIKSRSYMEYHDEAIRALVKIGGATVGPELVEIVRQELAYFQEVGPKLRRGWWNGVGIDWEEVELLRNHYTRVYSAIRGLKLLRFADSRETVTAFRDFWRSLPQLGVELAQMIHECDELLAGLRNR